MMTAEQRNGDAGVLFAERPPIRLGQFLRERVTVEINGQLHQAWVTTNRRYPRRLQAQLDRARARYTLVAGPLLVDPLTPEELEALSPEERATYLESRRVAIEAHDEAYQDYVTSALLVLIPTLDEETAELIDQPTAEQLLRDLGYFQPLADEPLAEGEASGADADPLTGATSPPDSAASIPDMAPTSS